MVLTPSKMVPLGTPMPEFELPDVTTSLRVKSSFFKGKPVLVMFICNHCPYVQHIKTELAKLGKDYKGKKISLVAISANDAVSHPDDAPAKLKEMAAAEGFQFAFLYDESQDVAKRFKAACTPDFFLHDKDGKLVYRGQLDDSRPGNDKPLTGADLRAAMDAVLEDKPVSETQKASVGCNIKWKGMP